MTKKTAKIDKRTKAYRDSVAKKVENWRAIKRLKGIPIERQKARAKRESKSLMAEALKKVSKRKAKSLITDWKFSSVPEPESEEKEHANIAFTGSKEYDTPLWSGVKPTNDFDTCVENRLNKVRELLLVKGKEYVRGNDRFHNFTRTAEMNRQTPTRALHGMNSKHLVSLLDMLDDIDNGKLIEQKYLEEKVGDAIVYFVLLEALIKDKYLSPGF